MTITIIYKLNENSDADIVFAHMENFYEAQQVAKTLNEQSQKLAEIKHGDNWKDYTDYYYAKEHPVRTSQDVLNSI